MVCEELDESTGGMDTDDDDGIEITAARGNFPLRDMPHPRFSCATFKFSACGGPEAHTNNLKPCAQCFCWCQSARPTPASDSVGTHRGSYFTNFMLQGV